MQQDIHKSICKQTYTYIFGYRGIFAYFVGKAEDKKTYLT